MSVGLNQEPALLGKIRRVVSAAALSSGGIVTPENAECHQSGLCGRLVIDGQ